MTTFYVVRHAHADWQPDERWPLSARGAADALRVADLLAERPITAIYASPARRAQQTIGPLSSRLGLAITIVDDLRERLLSYQPVDDFAAAIRAVWSTPDQALPGGESNLVAQRRVATLVRTLAERHADEQIVLATHGNLMALLLQHVDASLGFGFWQTLTMPDVYELRLAAEGATMRRLWSDTTAADTSRPL